MRKFSRLSFSAMLIVAVTGCSTDAHVERDEQTTTQQTDETPAGLEGIVAFTDSQNCTPSGTFDKLLRELAPMDNVGRPLRPFEPRLSTTYRQFVTEPRLASKEYSHEVKATVNGTWHGLKMDGLSIWWTEESDNEGFGLHFDNSAKEVIDVLNELHFNLPPDGKRTIPGILDTYLSVEADANGVWFTCS